MAYYYHSIVTKLTITYFGSLAFSALQKSLTETWHSKSKASIQSKRSKDSANCGCFEVTGQSLNLAKETGYGSHGQHETRISCLMPKEKIKMSQS